MGAETTNKYNPDEFLQKSGKLDQLFAEIGIPIAGLGETAIKRHLELVPVEQRQPKSHEQQSAEYFGRIIFPTPLRPAS